MEARDRTRRDLVERLAQGIRAREPIEISIFEAHAILDQITALDLYREILRKERQNALIREIDRKA